MTSPMHGTLGAEWVGTMDRKSDPVGTQYEQKAKQKRASER